jgi:hypothetical protein
MGGAISIPAQADPVPIYGPLGYHSTDQTIVTAKLLHGVQNDRFAVLKLPRSSIIVASEYSPARYPTLPIRIEFSGTFKFAVVAPDGQPLGEAVESLAASKRTSQAAAMTMLRPQRTEVDVRIIGAGITTQKLFGYFSQPVYGGRVIALPAFEGLKVVTKANLSEEPLQPYRKVVFLPTSKSDAFDVIVCNNPAAHPIVFCDYHKRINDLVALHVKFVDFRYNGGRKFANERMRMVHEVYCRYDTACKRQGRSPVTSLQAPR